MDSSGTGVLLLTPSIMSPMMGHKVRGGHPHGNTSTPSHHTICYYLPYLPWMEGKRGRRQEGGSE